MSRNWAYPVILERDARTKTYTVSFVDAPGATEGATAEEALLNGVDALETALSGYVDARAPLPRPSRPKRGQMTIRLSALGMAKAALYEAMLEKKIGRAELARRLHWHLAQVDRVLDFCHASKMEMVEAALAAIGLRLLVDVDAA